jgi:serine phosphatase RsbU (regulator of sigma subunit)
MPARQLLVADVLTQLAQTMDAEVAVARLARLLVPALADWCVVTLVDDDESREPHRHLRDVGAWHADESLRELVSEYAAERIASLESTSLLMQAIDTGEVVHLRTDAVAALDRVLRPGRARDIIEQLAPTSVTIAPLKTRGRTLGALTLFTGPLRDGLTEAGVGTLVEVTRSASLALDNARLYRRQRDVALTFQHSLLTAPVEPDHVQVVVRYRPAAEAARVGGDWYDAFMQPDGSTVVVIGDVVGHDIAAAAQMSQLRSMLRAIAVVTQESPAQVLAHLDAAARTLQITTMATVVVARIEQTEDERQRGVTRLRWSSAGHPPPMVVHPDGTAVALTSLAPGPLIGLVPDRARTDSEVVLDRGSTVLLYTDGLVERRTRSLRDGLLELQAALEKHADLGLDELCDTLIAELPSGPGEDDIAVVGVRLHRQDRPRPAEAGPNQTPPDLPERPADEPGPEVAG